MLARLESRSNPVSTGRFDFYDQCSMPVGPYLFEQDQCSVPVGPEGGDMSLGGASSAPSFDMSMCDEDEPWTLAASTFDLQSESDCSGIPKLVCAVHSLNLFMHDAEPHEVILDRLWYQHRITRPCIARCPGRGTCRE